MSNLNVTTPKDMDVLTGKPIRALQTYLRGIEAYNNRLPAVIPDGVFGERTENAVRAFQLRYGIVVTGVVDNDTWDSVIAEYAQLVRLNGRASEGAIFPNRTITANQSSPTIGVIKKMMSAVGGIFDNFPAIDSNSDEFCEDCQQFTKTIQRLSGLKENGVLDKETWNHFCAIYNMFVNMPSEDQNTWRADMK